MWQEIQQKHLGHSVNHVVCCAPNHSLRLVRCAPSWKLPARIGFNIAGDQNLYEILEIMGTLSGLAVCVNKSECWVSELRMPTVSFTLSPIPTYNLPISLYLEGYFRFLYQSESGHNFKSVHRYQCKLEVSQSPYAY